MGKTISKAVIEPTCDCCDKFVLYVLNGCKSECGFGRCCTLQKQKLLIIMRMNSLLLKTHNKKVVFYLIAVVIYLNDHFYLLYTKHFTIITFNGVFNIINTIRFKIHINVIHFALDKIIFVIHICVFSAQYDLLFGVHITYV